jgi:hypothetical protein
MRSGRAFPFKPIIKHSVVSRGSATTGTIGLSLGVSGAAKAAVNTHGTIGLQIGVSGAAKAVVPTTGTIGLNVGVAGHGFGSFKTKGTIGLNVDVQGKPASSGAVTVTAKSEGSPGVYFQQPPPQYSQNYFSQLIRDMRKAINNVMNPGQITVGILHFTSPVGCPLSPVGLAPGTVWCDPATGHLLMVMPNTAFIAGMNMNIRLGTPTITVV